MSKYYQSTRIIRLLPFSIILELNKVIKVQRRSPNDFEFRVFTINMKMNFLSAIKQFLIFDAELPNTHKTN